MNTLPRNVFSAGQVRAMDGYAIERLGIAGYTLMTRAGEAALMKAWQRQLSQRCPELRTRRNYPYQGRSDGFTTALRRKFRPADYLGIEIEVRNSLRPTSGSWHKLATTLASLAHEFCAALP